MDIRLYLVVEVKYQTSNSVNFFYLILQKLLDSKMSFTGWWLAFSFCIYVANCKPAKDMDLQQLQELEK